MSLGARERVRQGIDPRVMWVLAAAVLALGSTYAWEVTHPDTTFWSRMKVPEIRCVICGGPPVYYLAFFALCEEHGKELFG